MNIRNDSQLAAQLKQVAGMKNLIDWLELRQGEYKDALMGLSGDAMFRAQGRALELKEILAVIRSSSR